ncbi:MAG TPA: universal stress protein [Polyangiaceae bacterium]|jgi:nucleotide-binding universal stress UspA family protein
MPKRILVATDFSDTADAAFDYAVELAKQLGAKITVLHAYDLPVYGFPSGALVAPVEMATRIMTAAQQALESSCKQRANRGVEITPVVTQGPAWEEVHRVAQEQDADLIVIGTHGRKGLSRALLGSIAEKIIRTATRPVLTIHGVHEATTKSEKPAHAHA